MFVESLVLVHVPFLPPNDFRVQISEPGENFALHQLVKDIQLCVTDT